MIYESYGSAVQDANEVPQALRLLNAYPNPFSSNMTLYLYLAKRAELKVSIYNLKGQVVISWNEDTFQTGRNTLDWDATSDDGSKVASGVYIWKVQCGKEQQSCKVLLAK
jgi:flagellar hook assembly protein FlgD